MSDPQFRRFDRRKSSSFENFFKYPLGASGWLVEEIPLSSLPPVAFRPWKLVLVLEGKNLPCRRIYHYPLLVGNEDDGPVIPVVEVNDVALVTSFLDQADHSERKYSAGHPGEVYGLIWA